MDGFNNSTKSPAQSILSTLGGDWWSSDRQGTNGKVLPRCGRKGQKPDFISEGLDWKIYRAARTPGPGEYDTRHVESSRGGTAAGGRISKAQVPSFLDLVMQRAKTIPGPGEYDVDAAFSHVKPLSSQPKPGGRFNMSKPPSYLDQQIRRAKDIPGPCSYTLPDSRPSARSGGRFSTANAKSDVEWCIYRAKRLPAPGQYEPAKLPAPMGGRISTANVRGSIDLEIYRAKDIPGPGDYEVPREAGSPGVKFAASCAKSDLEWTIHRAARTPGPAEYSGAARAHAMCVRSSPQFSMAGRTGPATLPSPFAALRPDSRAQRPARGRGDKRGSDSTGAEDGADGDAGEAGARPQTRMPAVGRAERGMAEHAERVKAAAKRTAMVRKWRACPGFGRSFFL